MKRYAVDTSTLAESTDGAVVMVADLPVEAIDVAIGELDRRIERIAGIPARAHAEAVLRGYSAQLRDLLLAIRQEVKS